jgi:hypothetical protein
MQRPAHSTRPRLVTYPYRYQPQGGRLKHFLAAALTSACECVSESGSASAWGDRGWWRLDEGGGDTGEDAGDVEAVDVRGVMGDEVAQWDVGGAVAVVVAGAQVA